MFIQIRQSILNGKVVILSEASALACHTANLDIKSSTLNLITTIWMITLKNFNFVDLLIFCKNLCKLHSATFYLISRLRSFYFINLET